MSKEVVNNYSFTKAFPFSLNIFCKLHGCRLHFIKSINVIVASLITKQIEALAVRYYYRKE